MKTAEELFHGFTNTMFDMDLIMYLKDFKAALTEHDNEIKELIDEMIEKHWSVKEALTELKSKI